MATEHKTVLIAAHADDELLGAASLIRSGEIQSVCYPLPMPDVRRREAEQASRALGYNLVAFDDVQKCSFLYVPSPTDLHHDHQRALTVALTYFPQAEFIEYSIEKRAPYVRTISDDLLQWKREMFAALYPSQVAEVIDQKYFLFEGSALLAPPSITVTFTREGMHRWPDAPREVAHLAQPHRHIFHVRLTLHDLMHHDRAIEFQLVKQWAEVETSDIFPAGTVVKTSCEQAARRLAIAARVKYLCRATCEVSEDGENGATVAI